MKKSYDFWYYGLIAALAGQVARIVAKAPIDNLAMMYGEFIVTWLFWAWIIKLIKAKVENAQNPVKVVTVLVIAIIVLPLIIFSGNVAMLQR